MMHRDAALLLFCLLPVLAPETALARPDKGPQVGIHYRVDGRDGRVAMFGDALAVTVYLNGGRDRAHTYLGEAADGDGNPVLSGDWALFVDEERRGRIIGTRRIVEAEAEAGAHTLHAEQRYKWKLRLPVASLVEHAGNYRLRVRLGALEKSGDLLRVAGNVAKPEWISLEYRPEKSSYRLGEPITVHFAMRNHGEEDFPYEQGGDYRGANRHLRFAFTAESQNGDVATDPRPSQWCLGGIGMADPRLEPGDSYETDLPLLAYLAFPAPGTYTVTAFQNLGFGRPVSGLEEAGWHDYAYGGTFEVEITAPEPRAAAAHVRAVLAVEDEHERRRQSSFLSHPVYLEPLAALVEDGTVDAGDAVRAMGEILTVEATRKLLALARHARAAVRVAALQELVARQPVAEDPGIRKTPVKFHNSPSRRLEVTAIWEELGTSELWEVFEGALESGRGREASLAAAGILSRADVADVALLVRAAETVAPELPLGKEQRASTARLARVAYSFAWFFGAAPVAVDEGSAPGRLVVWTHMLRRAETRLGPVEEELMLRMLRSEETLLRHSAVRWLPEDFSRVAEIPWRALLEDEERSVWWYAAQAAKSCPSPSLELLVGELLAAADSEKRRDLEEIQGYWRGAESLLP